MPYNPAVRDNSAEYIFAGAQATNRAISQIGNSVISTIGQYNANNAAAEQQRTAAKNAALEEAHAADIEIQEMRTSLQLMQEQGYGGITPELLDEFDRGNIGKKQAIYSHHGTMGSLQFKQQAADQQNASRLQQNQAATAAAAADQMQGQRYAAYQQMLNGDITPQQYQAALNAPNPESMEAVLKNYGAQRQAAITPPGVTVQEVEGIGKVLFDNGTGKPLSSYNVFETTNGTPGAAVEGGPEANAADASLFPPGPNYIESTVTPGRGPVTPPPGMTNEDLQRIGNGGTPLTPAGPAAPPAAAPDLAPIPVSETASAVALPKVKGPTATGSPAKFTANEVTAYWPGDKAAAKQYGLSGSIEGGTLDAHGNSIWGQSTMEDFFEGKGPGYVTVAMDKNAPVQGEYMISDQYPGVVFRAMDNGGHGNGKTGTGWVDIAFRDPQQAKTMRNTNGVGFEVITPDQAATLSAATRQAGQPGNAGAAPADPAAATAAAPSTAPEAVTPNPAAAPSRFFTRAAQ